MSFSSQTLVKFLLIAFIAEHWFACLWKITADMQGTSTDTWLQRNPEFVDDADLPIEERSIIASTADIYMVMRVFIPVHSPSNMHAHIRTGLLRVRNYGYVPRLQQEQSGQHRGACYCSALDAHCWESGRIVYLCALRVLCALCALCALSCL